MLVLQPVPTSPYSLLSQEISLGNSLNKKWLEIQNPKFAKQQHVEKSTHQENLLREKFSIIQNEKEKIDTKIAQIQRRNENRYCQFAKIREDHRDLFSQADSLLNHPNLCLKGIQESQKQSRERIKSARDDLKKISARIRVLETGFIQIDQRITHTEVQQKILISEFDQLLQKRNVFFEITCTVQEAFLQVKNRVEQMASGLTELFDKVIIGHSNQEKIHQCIGTIEQQRLLIDQHIQVFCNKEGNLSSLTPLAISLISQLSLDTPIKTFSSSQILNKIMINPNKNKDYPEMKERLWSFVSGILKRVIDIVISVVEKMWSFMTNVIQTIFDKASLYIRDAYYFKKF